MRGTFLPSTPQIRSAEEKERESERDRAKGRKAVISDNQEILRSYPLRAKRLKTMRGAGEGRDTSGMTRTECSIEGEGETNVHD